MLVRIPVAGTVGKAVRIEPNATIGGEIGVNIKLPGGKVATFKELALALNAQLPPAPTTSATGAAVAAPTGTVFESQIVDANILARVASPETVTGLWNFTNAGGITFTGDLRSVVVGGPRIVGAVPTGTGPVLVPNDTDLNTGVGWNAFDQLTLIAGAVEGLKVTGSSVIVRHPLTATSYGGVLQANLTDKAAPETITGAWDFTGGLTVNGGSVLSAGDPANITADWRFNSGKLEVGAFGSDAAIMEFYKVEASPTVRSGFIGYGFSGDNDFDISNNIGDIVLSGTGVRLLGDTDVTGAFTVNGGSVLSAGDPATITADWRFNSGKLEVGAFGSDAAIMEFYKVEASPTIRSGFIGYGFSGDNDFDISNSLGDIVLSGTGNRLLGATTDVVGALTAISYGGITEANLTDKAAGETITGAWDFTGGLTIDGSPIGGADPDAPETITADWRFNTGKLEVGAFGTDNASMEFYKLLATPTVRSASVGFLSAANTDFTVSSILGQIVLSGTGNKLFNDTEITGALTAVSYGGITEANLLDKTAVETVTQKWTFNAGAITLSRLGGGGEGLILKDADSTGNAANNFIAFKDMNNTRQGWLGFGSSTNDDLSISTDSAFGDIIINPRGSNALRVSSTLATFGVGLNITGAITLSGDINALSYEGILGFNLIDKSAASVLISGSWRFTDEDLLLSNNIALTSIDPGGPVRNLIKIAATTGEVLVGDALNPMDLRATLVDIQAPVTATSYDGVLAANLLDKTAAETITPGWTFQSTITIANSAPKLLLTETDAAADTKDWDFVVEAARLRGRILNDVGSAANWLLVDRTGTTVDQITLAASTIALNANVDISGTPKKSGLGIPYHVSSGFVGGKITVSATEPVSPTKGDIWFDTS